MSNEKFYLTKRSNGFYYIGWKENDTIRWKTTKCDKKSDAILFLKSFKVEEVKAEEVPKLTELWKLYYDTQIQHIRMSTLQGYENVLKSFLIACGYKQLDRYTIQDVERSKQYRFSRKLSHDSVNIFYRSVKVLFTLAIRNEYRLKSLFSKSILFYNNYSLG